MRQLTIEKNQAGGRFDKFLLKYLNLATSGFIHKMLRKKNITLNGKKADGSEKLQAGDCVNIYFTDETFAKFSTAGVQKKVQTGVSLKDCPRVVYEDEHVLVFDKPSGLLSQKAAADDVSVNEYAIAYLLHHGRIKQEDLQIFSPSVCNRLDRNTTGLITVGVTAQGARSLSLGFKERTFDKYYVCIVAGKVEGRHRVAGYLTKDEKNNRVSLSEKPEGTKGEQYIETEFEALEYNGACSMLKVKLITGKTHQIRAHLAKEGHPLLGDFKYGDRRWNETCKKKYGISFQLLHSYELKFPTLTGPLEKLSGVTLRADLPEIYERIMKDPSF